LASIKNVHGNTLDAIGQSVVHGRYGVGQTLPPEPLLVQELGVSRTVVREAVKSLVAKGLLSTGPKVGTKVQPAANWNWFDPDIIAWHSQAGLSPEFLRELVELRRIVEPAAIRLAALRASKQDIAEAEKAYAGMRDAALNEQPGYVEWDLRFHQVLLNASGNRLMIQMSKGLSALLRISFDISTQKKNGPKLSLPNHRAVLDAVIARDPNQAEAALTELIDDAALDIKNVLKPTKAKR
jgi:DNA-binding FadR family transcriptional regulator